MTRFARRRTQAACWTGRRRLWERSLAFRIRPHSPWSSDFTPMVLELYTEPSYCSALLYVKAKNGVVSSTQVNVQSDSPTKPNDVRALAGVPQVDVWTDVRFDVTPRPAGGSTYVFTFTPENGSAQSTTLDFPQCQPWSQAAMRVGFHCNNGDAVASYDDVRVDWE